MVLIFLFWMSLCIIVYHLFLYPALLWVLNSLLNQKKLKTVDNLSSYFPSVTVLCPAYNEEAVIEEKIHSFFSIDYPADKIKMIIISDDSTDMTNEIVRKYTDRNIELIVQKPRGGKQRAHNLVQPTVTSDFVLSTDANAMFDPMSVRYLLQSILSDEKIGIVSGEVKLVKHSESDSGESLYWKYECFVKKMDSAYHSIIGANGPIYLIKKELFTQIDPASVDDFERTLIALRRGYLAKYAPEAIVNEEVTEYASEEFARKVRIITQEWFALKRNIGLLNPFKYGKVCFILFSHKIIRWLLFLFAFLVLITPIFINREFYKLVFIAQILFYSLGLIDLLLQNYGKRIKLLNSISYFTTMCYASFIAFIKFVFNKEIGIWNPVRKQEN